MNKQLHHSISIYFIQIQIFGQGINHSLLLLLNFFPLTHLAFITSHKIRIE